MRNDHVQDLDPEAKVRLITAQLAQLNQHQDKLEERLKEVQAEIKHNKWNKRRIRCAGQPQVKVINKVVEEAIKNFVALDRPTITITLHKKSK